MVVAPKEEGGEKSLSKTVSASSCKLSTGWIWRLKRKVLEMDLFVRAQPGWVQQLREATRSSKTSVR